MGVILTSLSIGGVMIIAPSAITIIDTWAFSGGSTVEGLVDHIRTNAAGVLPLLVYGAVGTVQQIMYAPFSRQYPLIGGFTIETPFSDPTQSYVVGVSGMPQDFQWQQQFAGQHVIPGLPLRTHTTGILDYGTRHDWPGAAQALELVHPGRVQEVRSETFHPEVVSAMPDIFAHARDYAHADGHIVQGTIRGFSFSEAANGSIGLSPQGGIPLPIPLEQDGPPSIGIVSGNMLEPYAGEGDWSGGSDSLPYTGSPGTGIASSGGDSRVGLALGLPRARASARARTSQRRSGRIRSAKKSK